MITPPAVSFGRELGYAEITSSFTTTVTTQANRVDVTGLTTSVTVGARPIAVLICLPSVFNTLATGTTGVAIVEGTTILLSTSHQSTAASQAAPITVRYRVAASAGSHTYKVMAWAGATGGTASIGAASTVPASIQVVEC